MFSPRGKAFLGATNGNRPQGHARGLDAVYGAEHLRRLRFVRRCRDLGFSLDQVRELMRLSAENGPSCAEVCRMAARHRKAIETKNADLKQHGDGWADVGGTPAACSRLVSIGTTRMAGPRC